VDETAQKTGKNIYKWVLESHFTSTFQSGRLHLVNKSQNRCTQADKYKYNITEIFYDKQTIFLLNFGK
jgi:hypothetical protein